MGTGDDTSGTHKSYELRVGTYYKRGHDPRGDDIRVGMIRPSGDDTSGDWG